MVNTLALGEWGPGSLEYLVRGEIRPSVEDKEGHRHGWSREEAAWECRREGARPGMG